MTTGFSGTNDTRLLLPLSIKQKDLEALTCTNGIVLRNLLIKERLRSYCHIGPSNMCMEFGALDDVVRNLCANILFDEGQQLLHGARAL